MDPKQVEALAQDIVSGMVHWDYLPAAFAKVNFMPLLFMSAQERLTMVESGAIIAYEHVSRAMPSMVNGRPVFGSLRTMTVSEASLVFRRVSALEEARGAPRAGSDDEIDAHLLKVGAAALEACARTRAAQEHG